MMEPVALEKIAEKRPYQVEAYHFVLRALEYTMQSVEERRHVSGGELVDGIQTVAKGEFGPMAKHVLNTWGVHTTRDFGEMVFDLVDEGYLRKTEEDCIDDFVDRYDFTQVFERDYYRDGTSAANSAESV